MIDLTNQLRDKGASIDVALREACPVRLRPVVMTSLTIILALLPAAIGLGAGSETNKPLSVAIIGGMISSTLLTMVVVPACGRSDSEFVQVAVAQCSSGDVFKRKRGELVALERWADGCVLSVRRNGRGLSHIAGDVFMFLTM